MFFGCEGQNLLELSNLYDLKEAERDFLLGAEQGYALAQFGSKRVIVHFKVGDYKKDVSPAVVKVLKQKKKIQAIVIMWFGNRLMLNISEER